MSIPVHIHNRSPKLEPFGRGKLQRLLKSLEISFYMFYSKAIDQKYNLLNDTNPDVMMTSPTKICFIKCLSLSFSKMRRLSQMQVNRKRLMPKAVIDIQILWKVWAMKNGMQTLPPKSSTKDLLVIKEAIDRAKKNV